jgi:radical SAM superfamily enzyme YgiQ (UPF0313 family)
MARIYVTEPDSTSGIGASGMQILLRALRAAGHDVRHVDLFATTSKAEARRQLALFEPANDGPLPRPDAWFVSVLHARQWANLPVMFRKMGLAARTEERTQSDPLVAFGGQSMTTPEPIAGFADVMALGDGEATGPTIAGLLDAGATRLDVMRELDGRQGFYVPSRSPLAPFVRLEAEFHSTPYASENGTPRIDLARGCRYKCAYCTLGWAGGTYREAPKEEVESALLQLRPKRVALYAPDYATVSYIPEIEELMRRIGSVNTSKDARLDVMRRRMGDGVDARAGYWGVDGLSERIRDAIAKPLPNADIVDRLSKMEGVGGQKKFFIISAFPDETDADMEEFLWLLREVRKVYTGISLRVQVTHMRPLPHTPLQWASAAYSEAATSRYRRLREQMVAWYTKGAQQWLLLPWGGRDLVEHEQFVMRSDRRAFDYLLALDGRQAHQKDGRWRDLATSLGLDVDATLAALEPHNPTPWDHVHVGIEKSAVRKAWEVYQRRMAEGARRFA